MSVRAHSVDAVDAVVVGSGPNGLAAAITLARAGHSVSVLEAADHIGGGVRSAELTLPGFVHDICSTIHTFGRDSPFFADVDLEQHGLRWMEAPVAVGHPLDDGTAVLIRRDLDATVAGLGTDGRAYERLVRPIVRHWKTLMPDLLAPFHVPLNPLRAAGMAHFGLTALQPATWVARRFRTERARAAFAGVAAHSIIRLTDPISSAAALVLFGSVHADGWPFPVGGSGKLAEAMATEIRSLGGRIETGRLVRSLGDLPEHRAAVFDVMPRALLRIAGDRVGEGLTGRLYRRSLSRYRLGAGTFKLDLAIEGAIPWRAPELLRAGTIHLGGTFEEIARSEADVWAGRAPDKPFVLLAQQSLFDRTRAPEGRNVVWAYCHVPNGSKADMTEPILAQIERFAPGFRERILAMVATGPADLEARNPNLVGGDISGGRLDLRQVWTRPAWRLNPYTTPDPGIFLCSAATPPGPGVHGVPGMLAAKAALKELRS